jgi:hypothetical protein
MSELTDALIAIAEGGCECKADECDGTCGPAIAERAAGCIAELERQRNELKAALEMHRDKTPCCQDHHGHCQTHRLRDPCEQQILRDVLGK